MGRAYLGGKEASRERRKDSIAEYQRGYYQQHREARLAYMKQYREKSKVYKDYQKSYYEKNKDRIKEYQKEYHKKHYVRAREINNGLQPIVTNEIVFDIGFKSQLKNVEDTYNALLKKYTDLKESYNDILLSRKENNAKYQAIIDAKNAEIEKLKSENNSWKEKVRRFFNI